MSSRRPDDHRDRETLVGWWDRLPDRRRFLILTLAYGYLALFFAHFLVSLGSAEQHGSAVVLNILTLLLRALQRPLILTVFSIFMLIGYFVFYLLYPERFRKKGKQAQDHTKDPKGDGYEMSPMSTMGSARHATDGEIYAWCNVQPNGTGIVGTILGFEIDKVATSRAKAEGSRRAASLRSVSVDRSRAHHEHLAPYAHIPVNESSVEPLVTLLDRVIAIKGDIKMANKNIFVWGPPGTGKSYSFVKPLLLQAARQAQSFVCSDSKGELYEEFATFFERQGYVVRIFNTKNPSNSDGWDPFYLIDHANKSRMESQCQTLARGILANTGSGKYARQDFWQLGQGALLKTLLTFIAERYDPGSPHRNLQMLSTLLKLDAKGLVARIDQTTPRAKSSLARIVKEGRREQIEGFLQGLSVELDKVLQVEALGMLSHNDIDMAAIGDRKTAIFVVIDDTDETKSVIASMFFNMLTAELAHAADDNHAGGKRLNHETLFILDEFGSYMINDFANIISNFRARAIPIIVIVQNLEQIIERYGESVADTVVSNCDTLIFLGAGNSVPTADYISKRAGESTSVSYSESLRRTVGLTKLPEGSSESFSETKRDLYTRHEILTLNPMKALCFVGKLNVFEVKKYGAADHPDFPKLGPKISMDAYFPAWHESYLKEAEERAIREALMPITIESDKNHAGKRNTQTYGERRFAPDQDFSADEETLDVQDPLQEGKRIVLTQNYAQANPPRTVESGMKKTNLKTKKE